MINIETTLGAVGKNPSITTIGRMARELEDLGYDGLVVEETNQDPFLLLSQAAPATRRIGLATGIAVAFPRSPMVVAMMAWDLQRLSAGRFTLGLGTQVKGHIERRFSTTWTSPGPRMREYVLSLRAIWDCWQHQTPLSFGGRFYNFSLMVPYFTPEPLEFGQIPIEIAAVGRYNCQLAGEICDGVRTHPIASQKYISEFVLPNLERGAGRSGRNLSAVSLRATAFVATGPTDAEVAVAAEEVRRRIAFYGSTKAYLPIFEVHGWTDTMQRLNTLAGQKRWDEMPHEISDEQLQTMAVVERYDGLVDALRKRYGGLASSVSFGFPMDSTHGADRLGDLVSQFRATPE